MSRRRAPSSRSRRTRRRTRLRTRIRRLRRLWPDARRRRRLLRAFRRAPGWLQAAAALAVLAAVWVAANGVVQVFRKPTELFFPISGTLHKMPAETWRAYAPLFRWHATGVITPELLAALAQVEGSGNPVARTYWRWSWRAHPFEVYRPASSAVGMYQITDGTFEQAKRLCIHDHVVVEEGSWHDWRSCWWNELYFRVVPSHAIELTSAFLDRSVSEALARHGIRGATLEQKQRLAAVIHLCGAGAGSRYAKGGIARPPDFRCGDHDVRAYLARIHTMKRVFAELAAADR